MCNYCKYLANLKTQNKFIIYSDSLAALKSIENIYTENCIAREILNYSDKRNAIYIWIPGHASTEGNEQADIAAKLATTEEIIQDIQVPLYDIKSYIRLKNYKNWKTNWLSTTNNKLRTIKDTTKRWVMPKDFNRLESIAITRARIGHSRLTHGYLMSKDTPPLCDDDCNEVITIQHILTTCKKYTHLLNKFNSHNKPLKIILGEKNIRNLKHFLQETELIKLI